MWDCFVNKPPWGGGGEGVRPSYLAQHIGISAFIMMILDFLTEAALGIKA